MTEIKNYNVIVFKEGYSENTSYKLPILANVKVIIIKNQETNEVKSKHVTFTIGAHYKNSKIIIPAAAFYQIPEIKKSNHIRFTDCDTKKGHKLYSQDSQSYIMAYGIGSHKLKNEVLFSTKNIEDVNGYSWINERMIKSKEHQKDTKEIGIYEAFNSERYNLFEKLPKIAYLEMSQTKSDDLTIMADNSLDKLYRISLNYKE